MNGKQGFFFFKIACQKGCQGIWFSTGRLQMCWKIFTFIHEYEACEIKTVFIYKQKALGSFYSVYHKWFAPVGQPKYCHHYCGSKIKPCFYL